MSKLIEIDRFIAPNGSNNCTRCGCNLKMKSFDAKRIVVTMRGRYDLDDVALYCDACNKEEFPKGFWPGSVERHSQYLFDEDVFLMLDLLQKFNPGLSTLGFLHTLEEFSAAKNRTPRINAVTFTRAFEEWRYCRYEIARFKKEEMFECPACTDNQHSVHIDGNRKLYRFSKVQRGIQKSYYSGDFIANNCDVDEHLEALGYSSGVQCNESNMCGTTRWKAAKASSKTMPNLDETGIVVGGCRHVIAQKAVNMFRGEIYGYAHYLHEKIFSPKGVQWLWEDIICQYWPWASSKASLFLDSRAMEMKPALSVLWGGRWQDEAAAGAGEDMEQLFSYLSRWNMTTKSMLAYRREDSITEAVVFWNRRKIEVLPRTLVQRLNKMNAKLFDLEKQLDQLRQSEMQLTNADLASYKNEIQTIARGELSGEAQAKSDKEKYYILWKEMSLVDQLRYYASNNTSTESILIERHHLFNEATAVLSRSVEKSNQFKALEGKLHITDHNRQQFLEEGKALATKRKLEIYQSQIEMLFLSIKKKQAAIQRLATTSKQRSKFRRAVTSEKAKLEKCVMNYNNLSANCEGFLPASLEAAIDGNFPWSLLTDQ